MYTYRSVKTGFSVLKGLAGFVLLSCFWLPFLSPGVCSMLTFCGFQQPLRGLIGVDTVLEGGIKCSRVDACAFTSSWHRSDKYTSLSALMTTPVPCMCIFVYVLSQKRNKCIDRHKSLYVYINMCMYMYLIYICIHTYIYMDRCFYFHQDVGLQDCGPPRQLWRAIRHLTEGSGMPVPYDAARLNLGLLGRGAYFPGGSLKL